MSKQTEVTLDDAFQLGVEVAMYLQSAPDPMDWFRVSGVITSLESGETTLRDTGPERRKKMEAFIENAADDPRIKQDAIDNCLNRLPHSEADTKEAMERDRAVATAINASWINQATGKSAPRREQTETVPGKATVWRVEYEYDSADGDGCRVDYLKTPSRCTPPTGTEISRVLGEDELIVVGIKSIESYATEAPDGQPLPLDPPEDSHCGRFINLCGES